MSLKAGAVPAAGVPEIQIQNLCISFKGLAFYQISVMGLWEYTCGVFLFSVCVGFFLFNQQAVLPFLTVGVFYFKF